MARQIFYGHGAEEYCNISTAGIHQTSTQRFQDLERYINESLRRHNYAPIGGHAPRLLQKEDTVGADLIFTLDARVHNSLHQRWKHDDRVKKLHFLPEYGLENQNAAEIFDPMSVTISPSTKLSLNGSMKKNIGICLIRMSHRDSMLKLAYNLTGYVPAASTSLFWEETVGLYGRVVEELEPCVAGAIKRLQKVGMIPEFSRKS